MATGYNPYRTENKSTSVLNNFNIENDDNSFFNNRIARLSKWGRTYSENSIKNAKGIHANEDLNSINNSNGFGYDIFSRKVHALMQEKQKIAALSVDYLSKIQILREYATKIEIQDYVSKMANELIVYGKDKKFCELTDLPIQYKQTIRDKAKNIFEDIYYKIGFNENTTAWDIARDWLVEGYICKEIIYDNKGKNIIGFQKLDPASVIPIVDAESGLKIWIQHPYSEQNRRILLDAEIIYISYSGSSNYMETSYVEPLIRPYNELKSMERSRLLFNLINATMHKEIIIPTQGLSPAQAEMEMNILVSDYKDHIAFDDTTGLIYIDGSKDLPYSKEYWFPNPGDAKPEMNIIEPGGHDLNENSILIWFTNALKRASKFPLSRLDSAAGGGNIYIGNGDITHDDYNFSQYVERLRTLFKDILLKPITIQLLLDFPELENNNYFFNDLDIEYYGHSELIKAKILSNLQARAAIAADLTNNLKRTTSSGEEQSLLHWKFIAKNIMEFTDEELAENELYWKEDNRGSGSPEGGSPEGGSPEGGSPEDGSPEGGSLEGEEEFGAEEQSIQPETNIEEPIDEE